MSTPASPTDQRDVAAWVPRLCLGVVALLILFTVGGPTALFNGRLPYTSDFTGHTWWLAAFRDALWHGHPLGWNSQINNGYLFGYTYFPLPALIVAVLGVVVPVALAIKLMVVAALVSLPFGVGQLCKGLGASRRVQALAIAASPLALLSNHPITIGGSIFDTMRGEFSMALAIGCGLCFLGEWAALSRGAGRWWVAGLWFAATLESHVQGALATGIVALCFVGVSWRTRVTVQRGLAALVFAAGLSAWWWMPAVSVSTQTLGDVNPTFHSVGAFLMNSQSGYVVVLGVLGLTIALWRHRSGANALACAVVVLAPTLLIPLKIFTAGRVYPIVFWLAVVGSAFLLDEVWSVLLARLKGRLVGAVGLFVVLIASVATPLSIPGNRETATSVDQRTFAGIEAYKGAASLRALTATLESLPAGRVMVETPANYASQFGDWSWANLLPLWTHGHDTSPSGLYVNASPSSIGIEYALENLSPSIYFPVISWQPSPSPESPQAGVNQLRVLGVRYFVVTTPALHRLFASLRGVRLAAVTTSPSQATTAESFSASNTSNTFWVYRIEHSAIVSGVSALVPMVTLSTQPYAVSMTKYLDEIGINPSAVTPVVGLGHPYNGPDAVVSDVSISDSRISFHVDRVGEPVVIRESYSPLWRVTGGRLYQAQPNEMLVWPTSTAVTMAFTPPVTQTMGLCVTVLSVLGIALVGATALRRRRAADED